jgi:hypothetical protein
MHGNGNGKEWKGREGRWLGRRGEILPNSRGGSGISTIRSNNTIIFQGFRSIRRPISRWSEESNFVFK